MAWSHAMTLHDVLRRLAAAAALLLGATVFPATGTAADSFVEPAALHKAVDDFLRRETQGLPGSVSYTVGPIDPRTRLASCPAFETFLAPGARLWGKSSVGVRCPGPNPWTIYVTTDIRVAATYFVSARPLAPGQVIQPDDLVARNGDLGQLPAGIVTDARTAVGKTLANGIGSGQPLRQDMLRAPMVVQQGQSVKLVSQGLGFKVSSEGRAINNALEGQIAQVRSASGQVISGVARPGGIIEVTY
jgi:flagellar basal body P-ring formation protein FlgA